MVTAGLPNCLFPSLSQGMIILLLRCMGNLFLCGVGAIVGDVLVHHGPEPFNWI